MAVSTLNHNVSGQLKRHSTPIILIILGMLTLYIPSLISIFRFSKSSEDLGHIPLFLLLSLWFIWTKLDKLANTPDKPAPYLAWPLLGFGLAIYILGRSQSIITLEIGSLIPIVLANILLFKGIMTLKKVWFSIFLLLFVIPLPGILVTTITQPLKLAVSATVTQLLYFFDYPISRSGVTLTVGPYQLLVADACAGLNSMFSLEALGLLYLNLKEHTSPLRNLLLGLVIIPISFCANVIRVLALCLITFYLGDAAGQGFLHGFSGMILFLSALLLILAIDKIFSVFFDKANKRGLSSK